jgi:flagellar basal body-associated protein FliL
MVAILKLFILSLIVILTISAVLGVVAFFMDLHAFKSDKDLSLPRKRLIETLYEEQDLKKQLAEQPQDTPQSDKQEPKKVGW